MSKSHISPSPSPVTETKTANTIIVTKSAMTAISKIICPMLVCIILASFNVGTTTPREIVEIINVIKKTFSINPASTNRYDSKGIRQIYQQRLLWQFQDGEV